jgi:uncharacterized membrane protein (DUF106 family)
MLESITTLLTNALDWVFGWILRLGRDGSLIAVAVLTSAGLTFVRKWVTDQTWLRQAADDDARLAELTAEARGRKDREAARRHRDTRTLIKMKTMRFEGRALLWALLPIGLLATWAFARLAFLPPAVGRPVEVRAWLPRTAIGQLAHLAPEPGIEAANGWVQVVADEARPARTSLWDRCDGWLAARAGMQPPADAVAVWQVVARDAQPRVLQIRHAGRTYAQPFVAGRRWYETPQVFPADAPVIATEVGLEPRRLFGAVGGIALLFLQPWLVAYLLIAIPFVFVIKRLFKIY